MSRIIKERVTVDEKEEFVVLLIGMRINKWWKVHKWLPVAWSMRTMVKQLGKLTGDSGYLGGEYRTAGNPIVFVQYWRSYDALEKYASNASLHHRKMWGWFFRSIGLKGDVGIYHESYRITPGNYECVYLNMPPFGLGKVFPLVPASKGYASSRGRMEKWHGKPGAPIPDAHIEAAAVTPSHGAAVAECD
ncbi:DUF4188 domain-containing protein [Tahibacter amnicola]|uniref:DUF4188 domain-containing protein n=1 Tax=Tahibacter amnicola TaxID=2976241 RepID=A0ABY6BM57_9GAMM|nr:DUF4188 domain-containing protein [Tahibacter amnicola]UXI69475.1 DUF4188 domain-containing protein [Tahibacter amnicola]